MSRREFTRAMVACPEAPPEPAKPHAVASGAARPVSEPSSLSQPVSGKLLPSILKASALLVALVAASWLLRRSGAGMLHAVRPGWPGVALMIGAGGAMAAAGLPRQVLAFSGGYVFGAPAGAAIALAGQLAGCCLDYVAARLLAWGLMRRLVARPGAARMHRFLTAHPFSATLTLRLLPVGSNIVLNLVAGASRLDPAAFFLASAIGYAPQTMIFALLGGGAHIGGMAQMGIGIGLFAASIAGGIWLVGRKG